MKFKKWLLKEEYLKTGSAIIYHRTKKELVSKIIATGFQAGSGQAYGKGLYATLDLESQNNDYMLSSYGNTLTKWFVPHLDNFVIFNPILANMVHGTSSIEEQLKKIVGENLLDLDPEILNYTKKSKSSSSAGAFSSYLNKLNPQQKEKIAGLIFSGEHDGNIFLAYKNDEIIFNGFFYAPNIMDEDQINQLKTGHGWQSRVGGIRIGAGHDPVYQMPKDDPKRLNLSQEAKPDENEESIIKLNDELYKAFFNEKLDMVKYFIKKGANDFDSALMLAAKKGDLKFVKYLIDEKEYNYRPTLVRAAASAAKSGEIDVVKYFIDEKGVKSFDDIMQQAASGGSLDVVKYFINEKGVKNFNDAMFHAASSGHLNVVEYLIDEKGADNFNGAIFGAALNGNLKMVKYLIDEKGISNFNSVMIAAAKGNHLNIIEYLIDEKGVNNFNDAMIGAAKFGHLDIVKFLIKKGANDFENAITSADEYGEDEIIDYIKNYMKENGI